MSDPLIYHICRLEEWIAATKCGCYQGSSQDKADGFIHFSAGSQIAESAARHRAGQSDLALIAVNPARLGASLVWEASRSGQQFPHFYGSLDPAVVDWVRPLPLSSDGKHVFPELTREIGEIS